MGNISELDKREDNIGSVAPLGGIEPPEEYKKLVELLCDYNLTSDEVDLQMMNIVPEWRLGDAKRKMRRYPLLARTVAEGKALAMRQAGADKVESIKRYVEAQGAVKSVPCGSDENGTVYSSVSDHDVRMKASDRILTLMGESPVVVSKVDVAIDNRQINIGEDVLREFVSAVDRLDKGGYETVDCDQTGER